MYSLRPASHEDVPALSALIGVSVRELSRGYYTPAEIDASLIHLFGVDTQLIDDGTYFAIEHEGAIAAAGGWSRRRTLYGGDQFKHGVDAPLDPRTEPARIRAFYVHPAHARRGLGRRLFDHCAADARAAGFARLELVATLPGEPLYRALGFTVIEPVVVNLPGGIAMRGFRMGRPIDDVTRGG